MQLTGIIWGGLSIIVTGFFLCAIILSLKKSWGQGFHPDPITGGTTPTSQAPCLELVESEHA
jgi:hypothetical protein